MAKAPKKETEQVRLTRAVMRDVRMVAPVLGELPNEFVERVVREALARELPRAMKELQKRATGRPE